MRKQLTAAALLSTSFFFLMGAKDGLHSEVKPQSSVSGQTVELEFKVTFDETKIMISKEGRWRLVLANVQGLKLETKDGKFETLAFDDKLPGFKVKAGIDGAATTGKVDYTVKAFVCNTDKSRCFPETHKGTLEWKKS